jgi:hypothetical protein
MIEVNKVAFVKTTEEPVFVLGMFVDQAGNEIANVRRPVNTKNGVQHISEAFLVTELQTAEDKLTAEMEFTKHSLKVRDAYAEEHMKATAAQAPLPAVKESFLN